MTRRMDFARRLRAARLSRGLSQRELAEMAGAHAVHICRLEKGSYRPRDTLACRLADALGEPREEFLHLARLGRGSLLRLTDQAAAEAKKTRMGPTTAQGFGVRLREARLARGLSQEELADKVGANQAYISRLESGRRPSEVLAGRLADVLADVLDESRDEFLRLARPPGAAPKNRGGRNATGAKALRKRAKAWAAFGTRLREARLRAGISLTELAKKVGTSLPHLCHVEKGRMVPSEKIIRKLADALGESRDDLLLLAGRIPSDFIELLLADPGFLSAIRLARSCGLGSEYFLGRINSCDRSA